MSEDILGYSSHDWRKNTDSAVVVDDNVEHTLKEGTPIAQFVLVPKEEPDFEMIDSLEDPNYVKEERFNNILLTNTFTRSYARVREFWKKYGW